MPEIQKKIIEGITRGRIKWQRHAFERMMERDIYRTDVLQVLKTGEMIEEYPKDHPLPSGLFLGFNGKIPLHVVASIDIKTGWCYIVTAYHPDTKHFKSDYKTRKK
ncbi:MAG: DUF4258 domain-containing protein [Balneolaceae bacterium]